MKLTFENPLLKEVYDTCDNYEEVILSSQSNRCIIFFSSNGLYFPNEVDCFQKTIISDNYFEWKNICSSARIGKYYGKAIFVRDIFKAWYVAGINQKVDSIDALCSLLKSLTQGYEITTVGSSAGGYIATVIGIKLNAARVYNFSGQYNLFLNGSDNHLLLQKFADNEEKVKYYDIGELCCCSVPILYFYPSGSSIDIKQSDYIRSKNAKNIIYFPIRSREHGHAVYGRNLPYLLSMNTEDLCQYSMKKSIDISPDYLLFSTAGLFVFLYTICKKWIRKWKGHISFMWKGVQK